MSYPGTETPPQQVTRIPPYRPGDWVKIRDFEKHAERGSGSLSGKVRQVKSLTCSITSRDQRAATWRIVFEPCGRCLDWHQVERLATPAEIAAAERTLPQ